MEGDVAPEVGARLSRNSLFTLLDLNVLYVQNIFIEQKHISVMSLFFLFALLLQHWKRSRVVIVPHKGNVSYSCSQSVITQRLRGIVSH